MSIVVSKHKIDWAIQVYQAGKSVREVAYEVGMSVTTTAKYLRLHGVKLRGPKRYGLGELEDRELQDWEWARMATWIDTEGCIQASKVENRYYPVVTLAQVDPRPLIWVQQMFGGVVHQQSPRKSKDTISHHWRASGGRAVVILKGTLPWMLVKAEEAQWAMELWANRSVGHGSFYFGALKILKIDRHLGGTDMLEDCRLD